jgi:hypothetical protein
MKASVVWKVVVAASPERLAQQLTALTAAGFTIHTIAGGLAGSAFTIIAYTSPPEPQGGR